MKSLFCLVVFCLFLCATTTSAQTPTVSVLGGVIIEAGQGTSHRNPSVGGFVGVQVDAGRFTLKHIADFEKSPKVYAADNRTTRNRTFAGLKLGKVVTPVVAFQFETAKNHREAKHGASFGAGAIFEVPTNSNETKIETYILGFLPDTSINRNRRILGGFNVTQKLKKDSALVIGFEAGKSRFDFDNHSQVGSGTGIKFRFGFKQIFTPQN